MRQRRPASAALTAISGRRPADRCTQMLARTPKRDSTPSACSDVLFTTHLDWHAAGAQARASVAPRVLRFHRGAGHRLSPAIRPTPAPMSSDSRLVARVTPTTSRILCGELTLAVSGKRRATDPMATAAPMKARRLSAARRSWVATCWPPRRNRPFKTHAPVYHFAIVRATNPPADAATQTDAASEANLGPWSGDDQGPVRGDVHPLTARCKEILAPEASPPPSRRAGSREQPTWDQQGRAERRNLASVKVTAGRSNEGMGGEVGPPRRKPLKHSP
jgi:hypothetical protein